MRDTCQIAGASFLITVHVKHHHHHHGGGGGGHWAPGTVPVQQPPHVSLSSDWACSKENLVPLSLTLWSKC